MSTCTSPLFGAFLAATGFLTLLPAQCGLTWPPQPGGGANQYVNAVAALPTGGFVVGGDFTSIGGLPNTYIAAWHDGVWSALGSGIQGGGIIGGVNSIRVAPDGGLFAGGSFLIAGGPVNNVARWDGQAWHALGGGITGAYGATWITCMIVMPNGDLVVAGHFYGPVPWLARWNGTTWSAIGGGGWEGIEALALTPGGDLLVAYADSTGAHVMRWNGATWTQLGADAAAWRVLALEVRPDGEIWAGGNSPSVARWNGSQWVVAGQDFSPGWVYSLLGLPNGGMLAAGSFNPPGQNFHNIVSWNGSAWLTIGSGVTSAGVNQTFVLDLARMVDGRIVLCGWFDFAGGIPAQKVALLAPGCPASAASYGLGCVGSAGLVQLTATEWPMLGGMLRAEATGLSTYALAVGVFGFSQIQVPLASGHPLGVPGCDLLVADQILLTFHVGTGSVSTAIAIPLQAPLVGTSFYHQVIPVELDAAGNLQAITSSNALALTIGAY